MFELLLIAALSCPPTKVINDTATWNAQDQQTLTRAQKRCEHYFPDAPCLKKLRKKSNNNYQAICGTKE